ncbi:MAG: HRDC domain-containing protein, partial [Proteobacteria bacterium]|nr:HRDC domain-containing protein [Pseudomonadota bacterium]
KLMSCVYRTGQRFGAAHVIDVLRGSDGERIRQFGHDRLSTHGIGRDLDARAWRSVVRQLVATGLLDVDVEGHGSLRLTEASREVLTGGGRVALRKPAPSRRGTGSHARTATATLQLSRDDLALFDALRALRADLAREQNVPAYVIFHDATLREIATRRPASKGELAAMGGIGANKLARYGDAVLDAIRAAT